ncbi:MAG: hypothetical protein HQL64_05960 [Magnetococcales bacterium]|nr:hypothetical protein [Magnetococcales bacterium]
MAVTQTDRFNLKKHDAGDIEWADDMNANMDDLDDALGLVLTDASDAAPGLLSQKVDGDTLQADTSAHKIKAMPEAILKKLYAVDGGSTNALSVAPSPAWATYGAGQSVWIKVANANTGATTLNVSGLGIKPVKKPDGSALISGDLEAGGVYLFTYDGADFQLLTGVGGGGGGSDDKKVKASVSDPTPGYLDAKVDGTTIQVVNDKLTAPGGGGGGGDYTIDDSQAPTSDTGPLSLILSWFGNMIKSITGKASWRTAPATTLEAASAHHAATNNPHSVTKSQVGLGNVANTQHNTAATTDPTESDDTGAGYSVGSVWVNGAEDTVFLCVDAVLGSAVWRKLIYQGQAWTQQIDGGEFWLFNNGDNVRFLFGDSPTSGQYGIFEWDSANDYMKFGTDANGLKIKGNNVAIGNIFPSSPLIVGSGSAEILRISTTLNMGLRTSSFGSGQGVFAMANAQAVPSTNPSSGGIFYVEGGALKYRGSGGTVTTIAPA